MKILKFKYIVEALKERVYAVLDEKYEHYTCYVPKKLGFFSSLMLRIFFSGIKFDEDQADIIRRLPKDGIIVYLTKHRSSFEYFFYFTRFKRNKLPCPEINLNRKFRLFQPAGRFFKIITARIIYFLRYFRFPDPYKGYIKDKLTRGHAASFHLLPKKPKKFYHIFSKDKHDPLLYLVELQKTINKPIYIVPLLMFFGKSPARSHQSVIDILFVPELKPGKLRKTFILFKNAKKIFVEVSEPLCIQKFIEKHEKENPQPQYMAGILSQEILNQLNRHRQSITGPILKSKEEIKRNILTNQRLHKFMERYSQKSNEPFYKIYNKANSYVDEIASKYSISFINLASHIVRRIINLMFEDTAVEKEEVNKVKNMSRKGPLILVPCHRSHIDYLILPYILYMNNIPTPHVAAGKNLSFWPIGPIFRAGGAFFLRRTFRGAMLYSKVFSEYVFNLLKEGFNIQFFLEGGRSRTGKMMLPKLGLLSNIISGYKNKVCEDIIFVPVYIGYDRVLEEDAYLNEIEGNKKDPENLKQVIKAGKFLRKKYGRIYIKFHDPISFKKLLADRNINIEELETEKEKELCRNIGYKIVNSINKVTVVTPHSLAASAILNSPRNRFSKKDISLRVETYLTYLYFHKVPLADTLMIDPQAAVEKALETYVQRKFIDKISLGKNRADDDMIDDVFTINENRRLNLEYYKNTCIAAFVPAAFTALSILAADTFQFSANQIYDQYAFLQKFFKDEFAYDIDNYIEFYVRKNIKSFIDDAILMPHKTLPDTYKLTSAGFRKLKIFSIFLKPYFESYFIVLKYFSETKKALNFKDRLKKISSMGNRMYKEEEIDLKESLSELNYKNAVKFFNSRGISEGKESKKTINYYLLAVKKHLGHIR